MAMTIHCDIVSAEEEIFSGRVTMVSATGTIGELGIMPGHAPLLTGIRPGPVKLTMDGGEEEVFFASGGYLEVQPGVVTVLATRRYARKTSMKRPPSRPSRTRNVCSPSRLRRWSSLRRRRRWPKPWPGNARWRS